MTCEICGGKGLLPLKRKSDGSIVIGAFIDCSCKEREPERYHAYQGDDIDFPVSETWREFYNETLLGKKAPAQVVALPLRERPVNVPNKELIQLRHLINDVNFKVNQHIDRKKRDVI